MNIAIIYGGRSGEHEISLISAAAIARAVGKNHSVTLIGITKKGEWYLQDSEEYERICKEQDSPLTITEKTENAISVIPAEKILPLLMSWVIIFWNTIEYQNILPFALPVFRK